MPLLRIVEGDGAGFALELTGKRIAIGRDVGNTIQIGDPKASRFHVEIVHDHGRYLLRDLGSSNGTWNESGRIAEVEIRAGSTFRIGSTHFLFEDRVKPQDGGLDATLVADGEEPYEGGRFRTLKQDSRFFEVAPDADRAVLARVNKYLMLLHDLIRRSGTAEDREALFELLDDVAADALEGDTRCAVFLPTESGWTLWPPHERRLRARFGAVPFARSLLAAARARGVPLLCSASGGDLAPSASMVQAGVPAAMVAPVRTGSDVHALLYVDRLGDERPFTSTDLEFLAAVANQMAVRLASRSKVTRLSAEVERLRQAPRTTAAIALVGSDPAMETVRSFVAKAGPVEAPVLILGESGTGKELVARAIHAGSRRASKPLLVANCAALAESLVESTLFGHAKGAFTGAIDHKPGLFELADQGTLFLDEVGELPMAVQAKLLRVLEQGEVQRVGDPSLRTVNVRVIAATNRDLPQETAKGQFREDLFHRLDVLSITLPPLRERPGDVDLLIDHFLHQACAKLDQAPKKIDPAARSLLLRHPWPGNARQLRNTMERTCILCSGDTIRPEDLPQAIRGAEPPAFRTPIVSLAEVEKMHILRILEHCGGNKKATAEILGIDRSTLYAKLRQYEA